MSLKGEVKPPTVCVDTPFAIETRALSKRFPVANQRITHWFSRELAAPVVDNVSLAIPQGELFGLLGPNGAGKTTLIKLLATLIVPTSGEAWVNGYALDQENEIKASLGLVTTDERSFYWRLTGRQNLTFFAHLHPLSSQGISDRVEELLTLTHLQDKADQPFRTYSTGMRQRLAIARALLPNPKTLFLDEPTRGLDPPSVRALHQLIREELTERQGLTILLTTHWLQEAEELCDRLAILHHGQVKACGTLAELRNTLGAHSRYQIRTGLLPSDLSPLLTPYLIHPKVADEFATFTLPDDTPILNKTLDTLREADVLIYAIEREQLPLESIFDRFTNSSISSSIAAGASQDEILPGKKRVKTRGLSRLFPKNVFRVAFAFLQRDWYMETSYRLSFLLDFVNIFFSVAVFYFVGELIGGQTAALLQGYGGDYFAFVLVGIAFARYFGVGISSFASNLRQAQTTGTLEAMLASPTPLSTIILSSSLWNFGFATFQVLVYLLIGDLFLGVHMRNENIGPALIVLLLSILVFSSLGILAASFIMVLKRGDPITWLFNVSFTLLGGVYYPVSILPAWLQSLSKLIPVTYSLQAMRAALLEGADWHILLPDIAILAIFGLVLLPLSLFAFRYAVFRARQEGSLTHF